MNNFVIVVFDSCRHDSFVEARPKNIRKLGRVEARWSYASWTAPSHLNLLMGLMPHTSPKRTFAADYYRREFRKFNDRLGVTDIDFKSMLPRMYLPVFLRKLGYKTHAMVSLPVLNPSTVLNNGFDSYRLMDRHNDMRAMLTAMTFSEEYPTFYLLNVGETHYPYALPNEPEIEWPSLSGLHGTLNRLDDFGISLDKKRLRTFGKKDLAALRRRQVDAVSYLDRVVEELFDSVPKNTFITVTSDHGELFGEDGYFGHGPIQHRTVFSVPFVEGKLR